MIRFQLCLVFFLISIAAVAGMYTSCLAPDDCFSDSIGFLECPNASPSRIVILELQPSGGSRYAIRNQWAVSAEPDESSDGALKEAARNGNAVPVPPNSFCSEQTFEEIPGDDCPIRRRRAEVRCRRPRGCSRGAPCSVIRNPADSPLCTFTLARCMKCCRGQPCENTECVL